eukprot:2789868-Prymnesium_polylepis.1
MPSRGRGATRRDAATRHAQPVRCCRTPRLVPQLVVPRVRREALSIREEKPLPFFRWRPAFPFVICVTVPPVPCGCARCPACSQVEHNELQRLCQQEQPPLRPLHGDEQRVLQLARKLFSVAELTTYSCNQCAVTGECAVT